MWQMSESFHSTLLTMHIGTWPEALPPTDVAKLRVLFPTTKVMRTIPVRTEEDVRVALTYEGIADFLLLDTCKAGDQSRRSSAETSR
jgi:phosphoribosylanthranilate isomerase